MGLGPDVQVGDSMSSWRQRANRVIRQAIELNEDASREAIRAAVDAAYPFGERMYHPYKIWLKVRREYFIYHNLLTDAEKERERVKPMKNPGTRSKRSSLPSFNRVEDEWQKAKESGLIS